MVKVEGQIYRYTVPTGTTGLVFNNGNGDQTNDITSVEQNHLYKGTGNRGWEDTGIYMGTYVENIGAADEAPEYYDLQGRRVTNPSRGIYIMKRGNKVVKTRVR